MSSFVNYLQQVSKHLLPPLVIFLSVWVFYQLKTDLVSQWFENFGWVNYASLAIAASIALQFGRSRLVFSCLLLILLLLLFDGWLPIDLQFSSQIVVIILLQVCWLLYAKDQGFGGINLLSALLPLALIALIVWFGLPYTFKLSQDTLAPLHSFLYQLNPQLNAIFTPFEFLIVCSVFVLALLRTLLNINNSRTALYFTVVVLISILSLQDPAFIQVSLFGLAFYYVYAVIRASFTMAFKDELTGISSRRALVQFVQSLGRKYTLVMCDIDHFKKFNDSYGHDVGDEVLRLVASKLSQVSGGGRAFRFGGEEFVIIFPRKEIEYVIPHIEQLRKIIADYPITIRLKPRPKKAPKRNSKKINNTNSIHITCSFGVAQKTAELNEFETIMKEADLALYAAKKAGRNCVQKCKL